MRRKPRSPDSRPEHELLPEAELEVLAGIQQLGEATATAIRLWLEPFRPMSHASVSTLLRRLEAKGRVRRRKADRGKAYLYTAAGDPSALLGREVGRVLHRLFAGDSASLVASLFGEHKPTHEELTRLKDLVASLEAEGGLQGEEVEE